MRVLDTDVCVELLRGNARVISRRQTSREPVATTWITVAELSYGAFRSAAPEQNLEKLTQFQATLPILGLDSRSANRYGEIRRLLERQGQRLEGEDLMIAAITLARGAVLVTGNRRHYDRIPGLSIEDWVRG